VNVFLGNILCGLAALVLSAVALVTCIIMQRNIKNGGGAEASLDAVENWLEPAIFGLVTQAERTLGGGGTGRLKLATVLERVIALLPDGVKGLVSSEWICARIEKALAKAKVLWESNAALLGKE